MVMEIYGGREEEKQRECEWVQHVQAHVAAGKVNA
jgi:hypothetical protein